MNLFTETCVFIFLCGLVVVGMDTMFSLLTVSILMYLKTGVGGVRFQASVSPLIWLSIMRHNYCYILFTCTTLTPPEKGE